MQHRRLGQTGLRVSTIGLGCMGMSFSYGPRDDEESTATIRQALKHGVDFFDTADVYGAGHNEELLSRALGKNRSRVHVATKVGSVHRPDGKLDVNGSPDYVIKACEASLRRLRTDTVDILYLHRVDPRIPIEETVGAMGRLVEAGKVRFIGLSEVSPSTLRRAHAVHPVTVVQSEYSLWTRDPEIAVLPTCRELGVGFVAYSPIGRGFLSGRVRDLGQLETNDRRRNFPRFTSGNLGENLKLADQLASIAEEKGNTLAQVAIAWLLARGDDVVPIPGTKRRSYLEENVKAADIVLSQAEIDRISGIFFHGAAAGDRFPPDQMRRVGL